MSIAPAAAVVSVTLDHLLTLVDWAWRSQLFPCFAQLMLRKIRCTLFPSNGWPEASLFIGVAVVRKAPGTISAAS